MAVPHLLRCLIRTSVLFLLTPWSFLAIRPDVIVRVLFPLLLRCRAVGPTRSVDRRDV